mgnify:CR=1 FL=1
MRSKFDAQLKELGEKLTLMGAMCEEAIANSAKALLSGDSELAKKLAPLDLEIDRYERDIEALCLRLLLQQQPVARDLRQISAALKMITDLERIGDQAGDIAEIIPHLGGKTGSEGDNEFTNAFVSTSLTVCIGAMAIVGSIQDGLLGDWSTLALKGALDCIIVCTMTASLGRGCIFSALPVAVFQGTITLFAGALSPIMTTAALDSLSLVGSMLIFCVGVNLIRPQTFRTANMLPSVVIAVIYALLF